MNLLDTDHVTVLRYADDPRCVALEARLQAVRDDVVTTTVITLEEQMRGWLAEIGSQRDVARQVTPYENLAKLARFFSRWDIVPFDARAAAEFEYLRKQRVRIGTPDLKLAAIALVRDALLLSANRRDFERVPGLRFQNWLD
jgi:tRNA(fMet)-specific endonuclease VapC